jgi:hypothetical protein
VTSQWEVDAAHEVGEAHEVEVEEKGLPEEQQVA